MIMMMMTIVMMMMMMMMMMPLTIDTFLTIQTIFDAEACFFYLIEHEVVDFPIEFSSKKLGHSELKWICVTTATAS